MTDFISSVLLTDTSLIAFIVANLVVFVRLQLKVTRLELGQAELDIRLVLLRAVCLSMEQAIGERGTREQEGGSDDTSHSKK